MALARLVMKRFHQRVFSLPSVLPATQCWESQLGRFSTSENVAVEKSSGGGGGRDIEVSKERGERSKLSPLPRTRRGLWSRNAKEALPFGLNYLFRPFGLDNALMQMSDNLKKIFENMDWTPSRMLGRMKEDETAYKVRFEVPGLSKEDLKITIEDGYLMIKGEHKEEDKESSDGDDEWYSTSYGYYNTTLLLPEDAKVEEIKAELKDGVLNITVPRSQVQKKEVKQVEIN